MKDTINTVESLGLCGFCESHLVERLQGRQEDLWGKLPVFFGLVSHPGFLNQLHIHSYFNRKTWSVQDGGSGSLESWYLSGMS